MIASQVSRCQAHSPRARQQPASGCCHGIVPRVGCFGLPECHFQNPSGASSGGGVDFCDELLAVRFWLDRRTRSRGRFMKVLTIDVGGTNVKLLVSGHEARRKFSSGPTMTAKQMVDEARKIAADWKYDVVSIGYPG